MNSGQAPQAWRRTADHWVGRMLPSRRQILRWVAVSVTLIAFAGIAGWPVYVHPQVDPLQKADAIVVLGGTAYQRYDLGLELAQHGYARQLLISRSTGVSDPNMDKYCAGHYDFAVNCFEPHPRTTRGEAEEIGRRAKQQGWHRVTVVTFTPHISRARYIVGKCFDGELTMVVSPTPSGLRFWTWMYIRQSAGYLRAFLQRRC